MHFFLGALRVNIHVCIKTHQTIVEKGFTSLIRSEVATFFIQFIKSIIHI